MNRPYDGPAFHWDHPRFTRRTIQTNCILAFDFDWIETLGHNQPKFRGLQDLSQTISRFAENCRKEPVLLLSDKIDVSFFEIATEAAYVAVVNIRDFLACMRENDRSALFFLGVISEHRNMLSMPMGTLGSSSAIPVLKALEEAWVKGKGEVLDEALDKAGSNLRLALLEAVMRSLGQATEEDLKALTKIFASPNTGVIADAAMTGRRRFAIQEFEELLLDDGNEHKFQPWFEANPWVLGSDCVRVLDSRHIDVARIADLLVEGYDGHADIVELKRPGLSFWNAKKDHNNHVPHPDLVAAIVQAQRYQFALEGEIDSKKTEKRLNGIPIAKPTSILIYGRSNKWTKEHFEAQRLLNAGFTNLRVVTFDQVLRRANVVMGRNT